MPRPLPAHYLGGTRDNDELDARGFNENYTIDGRGGHDRIYGGNGQDSLLGGAGNDLIYASVEDTLIDGGAGVDTVSFLYDLGGTGVNVRLTGGLLGPMPNILDVRSGVVLNVENLVGSNYGDYLSGNGFVNELDGGAGDDWLLAWGRGDFLTGGTGADKFDLSALGGRTSVTITDFDYSEGDRIRFDVAPEISWAAGFGEDADGNLQEAWIGTCDTITGGTLKIILLGADGTPSSDWITTGF